MNALCNSAHFVDISAGQSKPEGDLGGFKMGANDAHFQRITEAKRFKVVRLNVPNRRNPSPLPEDLIQGSPRALQKSYQQVVTVDQETRVKNYACGIHVLKLHASLFGKGLRRTFPEPLPFEAKHAKYHLS